MVEKLGEGILITMFVRVNTSNFNEAVTQLKEAGQGYGEVRSMIASGVPSTIDCLKDM